MKIGSVLPTYLPVLYILLKTTQYFKCTMKPVFLGNDGFLKFVLKNVKKKPSKMCCSVAILIIKILTF